MAGVLLGARFGALRADARAAAQDNATTDETALDSLFGAVSPAVTPGYQLQLVRRVWPAGWSGAQRADYGAVVCWVESGELTVEMYSGSGVLWHAREGMEPARALVPGQGPMVCPSTSGLTVGANRAPTVYAARNAGLEPVVLWEARLALVPIARDWQCA
jgi:hypothetical protein